MSRKHLIDIIERENFFRSFNKEKPLSIDTLTKADADKLYDSIDMGMSPENLHCDGEISLSAARAKARAYMGAVKELQKMGFKIPANCYEIS